MTVTVNGSRVSLPEGASVRDAVAETGATLDARGIAVAVNGEVVPRSEWPTTRLDAGDKVEVLSAVAGG